MEREESSQRGGDISPALSFSRQGLVLTVIAMCAVGVGVFWWARPGDAAPGGAARVALPAGSSSTSDAHATPTVLTASASQPVQLADTEGANPARHDPNAEPHDTPPARPEEFPVYDASAHPPVETAPAETVGADPANERAAAIRAAGEGGAEQLALLTQTLRTDEFARNRLLAINGLRSLASDPALLPQVLEALHAAQADRDANVSRNARDAYQELSRR